MERLLVTLLLCAFCPAAHAGCGGGLSGVSGSGSRFYIGEGDCDFNETMIVVSRPPHKAKEERFYKFRKECEYIYAKDAVEIGFTCHAGGRSPLAGARYRLRTLPKEKDECGDHPLRYYSCVSGCSDEMPAKLEIGQVECDG